jgi:hypothetical protein
MMQIRHLVILPVILWLTLLAACQPTNPIAPENTEQEEVQPGEPPVQEEEEEEESEQEEEGEEEED